MNILITGGSGYLASSTGKLLSSNHKINLLTRNPKKIKNLKNKNIDIIKIKDYSQNSIKKYFNNCDMIIHFVGMNKTISNINYRKAINVKLKSTKSLLELCFKNKIKKFIYISSMQVYKNFMNKKKIMENSEVDFSSGYNQSHLKTEKLIKSYKKKISFTILRPSSIFGFYHFSNSKELIYTIMNNFCYQAKKFKKIIVKNPHVVRNFLPMKIFVKALEDIIQNKYNSKNKTINVGYLSLTLKEVAELIFKRAKKKFNKKIIIKSKFKIKSPREKKFSYESYHRNYIFEKKIFINEIDNLLVNIK